MGAVIRWTLWLVLLVIATNGRAQPIDEADALFREGRALMDVRQFSAACEKFESSMKLSPALGTRLNLAVCNEKRGRLASAWLGFKASETQATAQNLPDFVRLAKEHLRDLTPRVPQLVVVGELPTNSVTMKRPGYPDTTLVLGEPSPVDPTNANDPNDVVRFFVEVPGMAPISASVTMISEGTRPIIVMPAPAALVRTDAPPVFRSPTRRKAGWAFVASGAVVATTAIALSIKWTGDSKVDTCSIDAACVDDYGRRIRVIGTSTFIAGAALTGLGAYLVVTTPMLRQTRVAPAVINGAPALAWSGRF